MLTAVLDEFEKRLALIQAVVKRALDSIATVTGSFSIILVFHDFQTGATPSSSRRIELVYRGGVCILFFGFEGTSSANIFVGDSALSHGFGLKSLLLGLLRRLW